jgi:hypothetical protein
MPVARHPSRWRASCHPAGGIDVKAGALRLATSLSVMIQLMSDSPLSNLPMKRTKACQLSVEVQRAGPRGSQQFPWPPRGPAVLPSTIT